MASNCCQISLPKIINLSKLITSIPPDIITKPKEVNQFAEIRLILEAKFGNDPLTIQRTCQMHSPRGVLQKGCSESFCKIHRKTLFIKKVRFLLKAYV